MHLNTIFTATAILPLVRLYLLLTYSMYSIIDVLCVSCNLPRECGCNLAGMLTLTYLHLCSILMFINVQCPNNVLQNCLGTEYLIYVDLQYLVYVSTLKKKRKFQSSRGSVCCWEEEGVSLDGPGLACMHLQHNTEKSLTHVLCVCVCVLIFQIYI